MFDFPDILMRALARCFQRRYTANIIAASATIAAPMATPIPAVAPLDKRFDAARIVEEGVEVVVAAKDVAVDIV
jgi:hypothetical protein